MKTTIKILLLIALIGYLVFSVKCITQSEDPTTCQHLSIEILDSARAGFITQAEVENLLKRRHLYPIDQRMEAINTAEIQKALEENRFVDSVLCYKAPLGAINIILSQRLPLLRVMADNGSDYYLDRHGKDMPPSGYSANLIVATGHITNKKAAQSLIPLALALSEDAFWDAQIEQIHVNAQGEATLVPRIGGQLIRFGTPTDISTKLRNLRLCYKKILPQAGWDKYEEINLQYPTQIICKKTK